MSSTYIPALKFDRLTGIYDWAIRIFLREKSFKELLIAQLKGNPENILDIGCGTCTLTLMMEKKFHYARITGLDGDPKILNIARKKLSTLQSKIELIKGMSFELPFQDAEYNAVTSSLMLHHLIDQNKTRTLKEAYRVLKPGGTVLIADWGKPSNLFMRILFFVVQLLDGFETTTSNVKGKLPDFICAAGFMQVEERGYLNSVLGTIRIYSGLKQ